MIEEIEIKDVATYGSSPSTLQNLAKVNFIFGTNGSGKTTISRIMKSPTSYESCAVKWSNGNPLSTFVYNRDFVAENFSESTDLKGVFTLGENQVENENKIKEAKKEQDFFDKKINRLNELLNGKDGTKGKLKELEELEGEFKAQCWNQKKKFDSKFQDAFEGFRGSGDKFKEKVLLEQEANSGNSDTLKNLEERSAVLFGQIPVMELLIDVPDFEKSLAHGNNPILSKVILGKEDVPISSLINRLHCSDWVKDGRQYYSTEDKICPFCQQVTDSALDSNFEEYFDKQYIADLAAVAILKESCLMDYSKLSAQLNIISSSENRFLDKENFVSNVKVLTEIMESNIGIINKKEKEPSAKFYFKSLPEILDKIISLIKDANKLTADHNIIVSNAAQEKEQLVKDVWRYILDIELKETIEVYLNKKRELERAVSNATSQILDFKNQKDAKQSEISNLESQMTGIDATLIAINSVLKSFGFTGFSLQKAVHTSSYRLIREDGSAANATLSEGEKTFITFLYFYHLLQGSAEQSGITSDRIIVFDDPVSSLDSDVLFIVSSLIRGLYHNVKSNVGNIKQIFILTHNVYFHKEISYANKKSPQVNQFSFSIVRKVDNVSSISSHSSNPISTSYELLWAEVRVSDKSPLTIRNTLRRILENYFTILGGVDFEKICNKFEGNDKLICRSLFSWVHDGSHFAHDDLYVSIDNSQIDKFLDIFRCIFERMEHHGHYEMMMGTDFIPRAVEVELSEDVAEGESGEQIALAN